MTDTRADRARTAAEQRKELNVPADGNGGEVVHADPLEHMLYEVWGPQIERQFPLQLKVNPQAWLRVVLTGMRNSKQAAALARCTRPSMYAAVLEAARFGLTPFTDEAAIIPYGDQATFVPMAQGFIKMFYNTGQVSSVVVDFIRRGEIKGRDWNISRGPGGRGFWHEPRYVGEEGEPVKPGDPILAYCYLQFKDGSCSEPVIITRWDAEDVMVNKSRAWQNAERTKKYDSLWHTDFNAMWAKTAVRRAAKYGPKSAELQELLLIEAREDRTRTDAMPAMAALPPAEGAGIDWSTDIAGGNVTPGEVMDDEPPPPPDTEPREDLIARIDRIFTGHGLGEAKDGRVRAKIQAALLRSKGFEVPSQGAEWSDAEIAAVAAELTRICDEAEVTGGPAQAEAALRALAAGRGQS